MSSLILAEGKNTPEIVFNPADGVFTIKGKSFPENAKKFYAEVLDWLDNFVPEDELTFDIILYYISS
ncbi:MAG: SiaC family regulatory phosphoprotein, partial [Flavobacteriales bacterium]|nr:SiaC family regulatory phosphoprotein [Flavobacteriales bacterium]